MTEMKRSRNYVTKLKQDLKWDYFKNAIRNNQRNSKRLWKPIDEAFGNSSSKTTVITELDEMESENIANKKMTISQP